MPLKKRTTDVARLKLREKYRTDYRYFDCIVDAYTA